MNIVLDNLRDGYWFRATPVFLLFPFDATLDSAFINRYSLFFVFKVNIAANIENV